jgi:hypothetical protein
MILNVRPRLAMELALIGFTSRETYLAAFECIGVLHSFGPWQ